MNKNSISKQVNYFRKFYFDFPTSRDSNPAEEKLVLTCLLTGVTTCSPVPFTSILKSLITVLLETVVVMIIMIIIL